MTTAHQRVSAALAGASAREFLESHLRTSRGDLAGALGIRLVPMRVIEGLGQQCKSEGVLQWFARYLVMRCMVELSPAGLKRKNFETAHALSVATVQLHRIDEQMERITDRATHRLLLDESVPDGWLPLTPDDPHLLRAFETALSLGATDDDQE